MVTEGGDGRRSGLQSSGVADCDSDADSDHNEDDERYSTWLTDWAIVMRRM